MSRFQRIVVFTGAGMSAESGVPTYRGAGGTWAQYNWEEYACQAAFDTDPEKVIEFHAMRRAAVDACRPHAGHAALTAFMENHPDTRLVTQNIDGMHQRAGVEQVLELHGSLWAVRCDAHGVRTDTDPGYSQRRCPQCQAWLRPAITWFGDSLDERVFAAAAEAVAECDLFISVGTSGVVWPAAGLQDAALSGSADCVEINPEENEFSARYDEIIRQTASKGLPAFLETLD